MKGRFVVSEESISARRKNADACHEGGARDALRADPARYALLVENMVEGLLIDDGEGRDAWANDRLLEIFGLTRDDLPTLRLEDYIAPPWRGELCEVQGGASSRKNTPRRLECEGQRKDGTPLSLSVCVMPAVENGRRVGRQVLVCDVTAHRETEAQLVRCERELAQTRHLAHLAGWTYDATTRIASWSGELCDLFQPTAADQSAPRGEQCLIAFPDNRDVFETAMQTALSDGQAQAFELGVLAPDGSTRWIALVGEAVRRSDGTITQMAGVARDVTQVRRTARALEDLKRLSRATVDSLSTCVVVINETGVVEMANRAWNSFATANGLVGDGACAGLDYLAICDRAPAWTPEGSIAFGEAVREVLAGRRHGFEFECTCHGSEQRRWFAVRGSRFSSSEFAWVVITHEEITERRRAEDALRETRTKLRAFYDIAPLFVGIIEVGEGNQDIAHVCDNAAAVRLFGLPGPTVRLGPTASGPGAPPEVIDPWIEHCRDSQSQGLPKCFEYEHRSAQAIRRLAVTVSYIGPSVAGRAQFCYMAEDLTGRRQAEESLRQSEQWRAEEESTAHIGRWDQDLVDGTVTCSPETGRILGVEPGRASVGYEALLGRVHPQDRERVHQAINRAMENGHRFQAEYRILRPDGDERVVSSVGTVIRDGSGHAPRLSATIHDVTEHRRVQKALRLSEERYRTLVSNIPGAVFRCDAQTPWRSHYCSDRIVDICGYPARDFDMGLRTYASVIHAEDLARFTLVLAERVGEGRAFTVEHRICCADGTVRWADLRGQAVYDSSGAPQYLDGVIFDVTRRKETETAAGEIGARLACLSRTERRVLDLLISGAAQKQVSARLGMSLRTVQLHRTRIVQKMRADSLAELVHMVATWRASGDGQS